VGEKTKKNNIKFDLIQVRKEPLSAGSKPDNLTGTGFGAVTSKYECLKTLVCLKTNKSDRKLGAGPLQHL